MDRLLREAGPLLERYPRPLVTDALRTATAAARHNGEHTVQALLEHAARVLEDMLQPSLRRVINATGVVLHTNLGRSVLADHAVQRMLEAATGPTNLEVDLHDGRRGSRHSHVRDLLATLTGAPAALVVNNCAAAVLLAIDSLARDREVIVSRGELIEIGGSYRLPDVLRRGGARLVEVGTTNRTYLEDYAQALTPETAMLLVSHPSNYRIQGFAHQPDPAELTALGREHGVVSFMDLGSGLLLDPSRYGLPPEPTVPECVRQGFDLVAFSGDKLLGGPQAGVLVGRKDVIQRLAESPLARAVRVDKLTLAALEGTLQLYLDPERALREIPTLRMLRDVPAQRTQDFGEVAAERLGERAAVAVVPGASSVGGGSMPGEDLPGVVLSLRPRDGREQDWAERLRRHGRPVLATCRDGALRLDLRTVQPAEEAALLDTLEATAP